MTSAELNEHDVDLFTSTALAHLATLMPDGSPQITRGWVDADGEHVLVNTAEGRVKANNIARDPRVALSVVDSQNPWRYALVRGDIVERRHEGARDHIDKMAKKYRGLDKYPSRAPGEQRIVVKIRPERVHDRAR